jgi:hypothetical protein
MPVMRLVVGESFSGPRFFLVARAGLIFGTRSDMILGVEMSEGYHIGH